MDPNTQELTPVLHPISGLPFDDSGFESMTQYLGDYEEDQRWEVRWDLPLSLPTGRYIIQVDGFSVHSQGEESSLSIPYQLRSTPFVLDGEGGLKMRSSSISPEGELRLSFTYVDAPSNDDGVTPFAYLKPTGTLLHLRGHLSDLSTNTPGSLREVRFLIGPPVEGALRLLIYDVDPERLESEGGESEGEESERPQEIDPLLILELIPTQTQCVVELVTQRDERGVEEVSRFEGVPCGTLTVPLTEHALTPGVYHVKIQDVVHNLWRGALSWEE